MKPRSRRILLFMLIIVLVALLSELILRPDVLFNSLGSELFGLKRYKSADSIFSRHSKSPENLSNSSKARYKSGDYPEAKDRSEAALGLAKNDPNLLYDRGNIAYQEQDYQGAVKFYRDALLLNPHDQDTKANLELALRKLQENPPPPPQKQEDQKDQKDQEEVRNILEALDNKEARDRQQQNDRPIPRTDKWW
ncbi:MAG TPA: tetratricopeptide repeat protein [Candidatus Cloacimonadota bacterium]|nr:tetratricopeptide repeat protein [Candidatus Cloacimonadota bacterium]